MEQGQVAQLVMKFLFFLRIPKMRWQKQFAVFMRVVAAFCIRAISVSAETITLFTRATTFFAWPITLLTSHYFGKDVTLKGLLLCSQAPLLCKNRYFEKVITLFTRAVTLQKVLLWKVYYFVYKNHYFAEGVTLKGSLLCSQEPLLCKRRYFQRFITVFTRAITLQKPLLLKRCYFLHKSPYFARDVTLFAKAVTFRHGTTSSLYECFQEKNPSTSHPYNLLLFSYFLFSGFANSHFPGPFSTKILQTGLLHSL